MSNKPLILICDDDPYILKGLELNLRSSFEVRKASSVVKAKQLVEQESFEAAIIDLNFEGQELDGIHLLDYIGKKSPGTFLIVFSGDQSVQRVVEAMRRKLFQFVHKGGNFDDLHEILDRAIKIKRAKQASISKKYLTQSSKVKDLINLAERIISKDKQASILITGETGSGKEEFVNHIGELLGKPVIPANMASIPKETAESTLFGHIKGSFTGAVADRIGLIENASGKLLFMDEMGECTPEVQSKLLRVLQQKEVQPLGSNFSRKVNTQFIFATHRDLNKMVEEGAFRQDLLQRINTFVLRLPPLRERPEDIIFYADLFLLEHIDETNLYTISEDGKAALLSYSWPGNIRELKSVIQRFAVLSNKLILNAEEATTAINMGNECSITSPIAKVEILSGELKKSEIIKALVQSKGNKRKAATNLGISERTFHRWVNEFGLRDFNGAEA